jgi:ADP-ribosylation factor related protein 1
MEPAKIMPTVGLNVGRVEAHGASLVFWDLGGASSLRGIWEKYYGETHGLVFVVDAAQPQRFDEAKVCERGVGDGQQCVVLVVLVAGQVCALWLHLTRKPCAHDSAPPPIHPP